VGPPERRPGHLVSVLASIHHAAAICQAACPDKLRHAISSQSSAERRYGGKSAPERRALRREQLLDAGLELFGTDGYAATTIEGLCARAGLNPRYFYEQFSGRQPLLGAVYERHVNQVLAVVRDALERAGDDPAQRLRAGLVAFVEATLADERGARVNYFEMIGVSPELDALRRRVLSDYAELIVAQAGEPAVGIDLRMAAVALVGATDGLIIDWLSGDRSRPPEAIVRTLVAVFAPIIVWPHAEPGRQDGTRGSSASRSAGDGARRRDSAAERDRR
jgi:AcrR family transcriptional regulator